MCGIIGFNSKSEALGREMCASIAHRGPDDEGVFLMSSQPLMFKKKFPDLLFAAVSFHKSVSRIL